MIESINISAFQHFCSSQFSLRERTKRIKDCRQKPQIPTWQIYEGTLWGYLFRKKSFLQIDQVLRVPEIRKFLGSNRCAIASDTEIARVLGLISDDELRALNYLVYGRAKAKGLAKLKDPLLAGLRVAIMDGSCFKIFSAVVCEFLSDPPLFLDFEFITKKGKELPGARKLIKRITKRLGRKWVDLILYDGLYVAQGNINQCLRDGIDVLIKTDEVGLNIIEDAEGIFNHWTDFKESVAYETGLDEERLVSYEIWSAPGFRLDGVGKTFKVARVKEKHLKSGAETVFWVITTKESLDGKQMRELAHRRWSIENNGFKELNDQVHSKRVWTHDENVWQELFWIQMMAVNLMGLFVEWVEQSEGKLSRSTRDEQSMLLFASLIRAVAQGQTSFN